MHKFFKHVLAMVCCGMISTCGSPDSSDTYSAPEGARFIEISSEDSGLEFANNLALEADFDVFRYRNYYNGGGVAIGDLNNDGLADVYLTANTERN
ncbi:MAG: hypothetical protein AAFY36_02010, partial [Bacteroidota bacterium]